MRWLAWILLLLAGCTGVPEGLHPVEHFQVQRYLGRWYEIVRLDHPFERGLSHVSAEYKLRDDGRLAVTNRGYDAAKEQWREAHGVARFQGAKDVGSLEVSFFWPFYGAYNVLVLDPDYRYAMVAGPDRDYLWVLAREPHLDQATLDKLIDQAKDWGFATDKLIYMDHNTPVK